MTEYCPLFPASAQPEVEGTIFLEVPEACLSCARVALDAVHDPQNRQSLELDDEAWDMADAITGGGMEYLNELEVRPGEGRRASITFTRARSLSSDETNFTAWEAIAIARADFQCSRGQE